MTEDDRVQRLSLSHHFPLSLSQLCSARTKKKKGKKAEEGEVRPVTGWPPRLVFSLSFVRFNLSLSATGAADGREKTKEKGGGMRQLGRRRGDRQRPPRKAALSRSHSFCLSLPRVHEERKKQKMGTKCALPWLLHEPNSFFFFLPLV